MEDEEAARAGALPERCYLLAYKGLYVFCVPVRLRSPYVIRSTSYWWIKSPEWACSDITEHIKSLYTARTGLSLYLRVSPTLPLNLLNLLRERMWYGWKRRRS